MAYDKVIDSSGLEANLTSVANAIRSKGGTSVDLAFPDGFVSAISAIKTGGNIVVRTITFASALNNTEKTLLTADPFTKEHYSCTGFSAVLVPVDAESITNSTNAYVPFVYSGNRAAIKTGSSSWYGFYFRGGASSPGLQGNATKLTGTGWNVSLRAKNTGDLTVYVASSLYVPAGTYYIILYCAE